MSRTVARRPRGPARLLLDRHYLLCGRDNCFELIGDIESDVWDPELTGGWVHVAKLRGSGWHRGSDGTWRLESHARERVRRGRPPAASRQRVTTTITFDRPVGGGPVRGLPIPDLVDAIDRLPADATELRLRGHRSPEFLRPGDRVACGRCGTISVVDEAVLTLSEEAAKPLRDAGLIT